MNRVRQSNLRGSPTKKLRKEIESINLKAMAIIQGRDDG